MREHERWEMSTLHEMEAVKAKTGESYRFIADMLGVKYGSFMVMKSKFKDGTYTGAKEARRRQTEDMAVRYMKGDRICDIARDYKISSPAVLTRLKRIGVDSEVRKEYARDID